MLPFTPNHSSVSTLDPSIRDGASEPETRNADEKPWGQQTNGYSRKVQSCIIAGSDEGSKSRRRNIPEIKKIYSYWTDSHTKCKHDIISSRKSDCDSGLNSSAQSICGEYLFGNKNGGNVTRSDNMGLGQNRFNRCCNSPVSDREDAVETFSLGHSGFTGSAHVDLNSGRTSYQELDIPTNVCNAFWKLALKLNPFNCNSKCVLNFASLWPERKLMDEPLLAICHISSNYVFFITKFAIFTGLLDVCKALIDLNIISLNQTFEDEAGLLHLAILAQAKEIYQFLINAGVDPSIRDAHGRTAMQLCAATSFCQNLPTYQQTTPTKSTVLRRAPPTLCEKQMIFELARSFQDTEKLLIKLQSLDFNVNSEMDDTGDLLVHVAVKEGLCQLSLLYLLVKIFGADVDIPNRDGLTCLMLASSMEATVLVDFLLCVIGAKPNLKCRSTGWTALHFACCARDPDVVRVLLQRGASFIVEDKNGARPEEIAVLCHADECREAIEMKRHEEIEALKLHIAEDRLLDVKQLDPVGIFATDSSGNTLIMLAVKAGSLKTLEFLLKYSGSVGKSSEPKFINAQHFKTLRTALAIAVIETNILALKLLMTYDANPRLRDAYGMTPLDLAVLNDDVDAVRILLSFNSALSDLQHALNVATSETIKALLNEAKSRRQRLISHELFEYSINGDDDSLFCLLEPGDDVNPVNEVGDWPLYVAVKYGHFNVVRQLLQCEGNFQRIHPENGNTVLHVSCSQGHVEISELLLSYLSDLCKNSIETDTRDFYLNFLNHQERTPLMLAAEAGNLELVGLLLKQGSSTEVLNSSGHLYSCEQFDGIQHLLVQRRKQHSKDVFQAIREKNGKNLKNLFVLFHDHNLRDENGDSPLMKACLLRKKDVVSFLLQSISYEICKYSERFDRNRRVYAGIVPSASSDYTTTDSHEGTSKHDELQHIEKSNYQKSSDEITSSLVASMNSYNQPNPVITGNKVFQLYAVNQRDEATVFHRLIEAGDDVRLLEILLGSLETEHEQVVNSSDVRGFTPLHLACKLGRRKIIQKLTNFANISYVDLNIRTLDGSLPEDLTTNKSLIAMVKKARSQSDSATKCLFRSLSSSLLGSQRSCTDAASIDETQPSLDFERLADQFNEIKNSYLFSGTMMYS